MSAIHRCGRATRTKRADLEATACSSSAHRVLPNWRGRSGIWVPGGQVPELADFRGVKVPEDVMGIRITDELRLRARMGRPALGRTYHIPNGGGRSAREGGRLKAQGVRAGVLDYCLPVARGGYHAMYLELKRHDGRLDPDQRAEIEQLHADGYHAVCAWGIEAAVTAFLEYEAGIFRA